jgi:hypothetical protein
MLQTFEAGLGPDLAVAEWQRRSYELRVESTDDRETLRKCVQQ